MTPSFFACGAAQGQTLLHHHLGCFIALKLLERLTISRRQVVLFVSLVKKVLKCITKCCLLTWGWMMAHNWGLLLWFCTHGLLGPPLTLSFGTNRNGFLLWLNWWKSLADVLPEHIHGIWIWFFLKLQKIINPFEAMKQGVLTHLFYVGSELMDRL